METTIASLGFVPTLRRDRTSLTAAPGCEERVKQLPPKQSCNVPFQDRGLLFCGFSDQQEVGFAGSWVLCFL